MLKLAFLMNWAAPQSFSNGVTLSLLFKLLGCMCGRNHLLHIEHWHCFLVLKVLMSKSSKKSVSFSRLLGCKWAYKPSPQVVKHYALKFKKKISWIWARWGRWSRWAIELHLWDNNNQNLKKIEKFFYLISWTFRQK